MMRTPDDSAGKQAKCPHCSTVVPIPQADDISFPASAVEAREPSPARKVPPPPQLPPASPTNPYVAPASAAPAVVGTKTPGNVTAIRTLLIVGGAWSLMASTGAILLLCVVLLWPGTILEVVTGIFALINGAKTNRQRIPTWIPILQIICIINCDVVSLVLGIVELVLLKEPDVQAYLTE